MPACPPAKVMELTCRLPTCRVQRSTLHTTIMLAGALLQLAMTSSWSLPKRLPIRLPNVCMNFEPDALSLAFPSPVLRMQLGPALPEGTIAALEEAVLVSYAEYSQQEQQLAADGAATPSNNRFFGFQKFNYGEADHQSDPQGWMASEAAQHLLDAVTAAATAYLERVGYHAHHADKEVALDPDCFHMWASVHTSDSSTHPRHVHPGAVVSCVFYVRASGE